MTTPAPEPNRPHLHIAPGEVKFDFIPQDWALTPLRGKRAYVPGWSSDPFSLDQIKREFEEWSVSVSRSALGADYPEGLVLPTGRRFDPVVDERRERRFARWAEEIRLADSE